MRRPAARLRSRAALALAALSLIVGCARVQDLETMEVEMPPRPSLEDPDNSVQLRAAEIRAQQRRDAAAQGVETAPRGEAIGSQHRQRPQPQIYAGDRTELVHQAIGRQGATRTPEGDVNLNFADAEIEEAARLIFGNILERNYVVSPEVSGRVTFQTSRPIPRDAVGNVFDAVLSSIGATLVDRGDVVEIVPLSAAPGAGAPISFNGSRTPGYRIQVVALNYVKASKIQPIIASISGGDQAVLSVDDSRNLIVLAGTARTLKPLQDAIALFDSNWLAGMSFGVYPLENVAAETAVKDMEAIFADEGTGPGLAVRFVPVTRMNAVIVIAPTTATVNEMINWLRQLDRSSVTNEERIFVYFAQNTKATDLASALNNVLAARGSSGGAGQASLSLSDSGSSGGLPTGGLPVTENGEIAPLGDQDPANALNSAAAALAAGPSAPVAGQRAGSGVDVGALNRNTLNVVAEDTRNAVLVAASPQDWRKIEAILTQLDVPPLQVLLEVTIAEVTLNDSLEYGLQWFFRSGNNDVTLSNVASGAVGATFPGFNYVFSTDDVQVALDALSDITDVDVISSPSLMVVNNETASLQVGDQVPVTVQTAQSSTDPDSNIVNSIQYRDTGVTLNVTPRVNTSGLVLAEIEQEVSTVSETTSSGIDSPTISQRKISSTIAVSDGQAITLGGLIQDSRTRSKSGVPGISEVPFLGALFRSTGDTARRTELLVILTPRVVRDGADAKAVTDELRSRLSKARQARMVQSGAPQQ